MIKNYIIIFVLSTLLTSCLTKKESLISYSNPEIEYWGRVDTTNINAAKIYWPGSSIKMNFEGESVHALFNEELGENYYNIIIDNEIISILRTDSIKQYYELASNLTKGKHTVEIFKRSELGTTNFYGFKINEEGKLLPKSVPKKRNIEFYGNSITAGYAIDDISGRDLHDSIYTNNYKSYGAITARHYDAKYHCVCKSGIGVMVSWDPLIMPEIYDKLSPTDISNDWDFNLYKPNIVVVNLFQNDSWLVNLPDHIEFKNRFVNNAPNEEYIINAYQEFLTDLRTHYPKASIISTLGSMDAAKKGSKWIGYIESAVTNLNDDNIYTHFMPYIKSKAHPSIEDNQIMSNSLIDFIDNNIDW